MKISFDNCYAEVLEGTLPCSISQIFTYKVKQYYKLKYPFPSLRSEIKTFSLLRSNRFPCGLLGRVAHALAALEEPVEYIDCRHRPKGRQNASPFPISPDLWSHQADAIQKFLQVGRGFISHPTGSGKTRTALEVLNAIDRPSVFIVPNLIILNKTVDEVKDYFGEEYVGIAGEGKWIEGKFIIATPQTLWRRQQDNEFKKLCSVTDCLIIDECHHVGFSRKVGKRGSLRLSSGRPQNTWYAISQMFDAFYRLGLSATPGLEGSAERVLLEATTGRMLHYVDDAELIDCGVLAPVSVIMYEIDHTGGWNGNDWHQAQREGILENDNRNQLICKLAMEEVAQGRKVLVVVDRVQTQGKALSSIPGSVYLTGFDGAQVRKEGMAKFRSGESKVLLGTIFGEGVDIPELDTLILACGGAGRVKIKQALGRLMRAFKGKNAKLIDFLDNDGGVLFRHSRKRLSIYKSYGRFTFEVKKENL